MRRVSTCFNWMNPGTASRSRSRSNPGFADAQQWTEEMRNYLATTFIIADKSTGLTENMINVLSRTCSTTFACAACRTSNDVEHSESHPTWPQIWFVSSTQGRGQTASGKSLRGRWLGVFHRCENRIQAALSSIQIHHCCIRFDTLWYFCWPFSGDESFLFFFF